MTVFLVGAGPGDPGLLTVRGREVLEQAEVVVYDRLSVASLLDLAPHAAERISVGKRPGHATMAQEDINALLVERGRAGQAVVRLKGGDPFVFARGGEEARALLDAGVPFEIVPGITSAIAVPAYAGIPVTMRHSSTSFTVVSGHEDPTVATEVDWDAVARVGGTIVILMGVARIAGIAARLMAAGRSPDTPVAAVRWGTRPEQHTVVTTLAEVGAVPLESPSTIVVGPVAALGLEWFAAARPLLGRRVVVTRPAADAVDLVRRLERLGAEVVAMPTIAIEPDAGGGRALADALSRVGDHHWVVFTSANAVDAVFAHLHDARALAGPKIAAVGDRTAAALAARGIVADLVPPRFVGQSVVDVFPDPPEGGRVLLPRAAEGTDVIPDGLGAAGWHVEVVEAYRTVVRSPADAELTAARSADVVTFASGSAVEGWCEAMGPAQPSPAVVCIGPTTAATAHRLGLDVAAVADPHTTTGIVDAVVAVLTGAPPAASRR